MANTKVSSTRSESNSSAALMPSASAPSTPANFKPYGVDAIRRMLKPLADQLASAESVASEVERSKSYVDDFGAKAISADSYASLLRVAAAWSNEQAHARSWADYTESRAQQVWDEVLRTTTRFKADFEAAVGHDESIPRRYRELTAFVRARSGLAQRAVETKKKKKADKNKLQQE